MYKIILAICIFTLSYHSYGQTQKVAILEFDNISGKSEFDSYGKAIQAMLITDLQSNIHPKKIEFFERVQLNKVLSEQNLQKSKDFDATTSVDFGKLSGVSYVIIGTIFVVDGNCDITSKLVEVKTSKIVLSKSAIGKIDALIQLKSQLAESIAQQLNNPIILDPSYKNGQISASTISQYAKVLTLIDQGDFENAEQLRSVFEETNPSFKYYTDLKDDIIQLKKQVEKNTADIGILNKSGGRVIDAKTLREILINIANPLSTYDDRKALMTEILKKSVQEINEEVAFKDICTFPSSNVERWRSYSKGNPTPKTIELYSKDLEYINSLFGNKDINKSTFSYFAFYYLRLFAQQKSNINDLPLFEKALKMSEGLKIYNSTNKVAPYDITNFGGESMYSYFFEKDIDLTIDHLIELFK